MREKMLEGRGMVWDVWPGVGGWKACMVLPGVGTASKGILGVMKTAALPWSWVTVPLAGVTSLQATPPSVVRRTAWLVKAQPVVASNIWMDGMTWFVETVGDVVTMGVGGCFFFGFSL